MHIEVVELVARFSEFCNQRRINIIVPKLFHIIFHSEFKDQIHTQFHEYLLLF